MRDETKRWIEYAAENLKVARMTLDNRLFNACLQNAQQSVEKNLKALFLEHAIKLIKTHSIERLGSELNKSGFDIKLPSEDMELLDSIYAPSKYPMASSLPDFEPDSDTCNLCISIAEQVEKTVKQILKSNLEGETPS